MLAPVLIGLAALTAGYTAPLLGQCEARDLWQSRLLLPHLIAHAIVAGVAVVIIAAATTGVGAASSFRVLFIVAVLATGALSLADAITRHPTANATAAAPRAHARRAVPILLARARPWCRGRRRCSRSPAA